MYKYILPGLCTFCIVFNFSLTSSAAVCSKPVEHSGTNSDLEMLRLFWGHFQSLMQASGSHRFTSRSWLSGFLNIRHNGELLPKILNIVPLKSSTEKKKK